VKQNQPQQNQPQQNQPQQNQPQQNNNQAVPGAKPKEATFGKKHPEAETDKQKSSHQDNDPAKIKK
jgi:hypothetical protein